MGFLSRIVNRIGRFFVTVVRSCYDMEFYREVRRAQSTAAFRYVVTFHLAVVLIGTFLTLPAATDGMAQARERVRQVVPDGARVEVRGGKLSTSFASPTTYGDARLPVVIDTTRFGSTPPAPVGEDDALIFGRDALFAQEDGGASWNVVSYADVGDFALTKDDAMRWFDAYGTTAAVVATCVLALLAFLWLVASTAAFVLVIAVAAAAFGRAGGIAMTYDQWLATGFHAVTLPSLLNVAFAFTDKRIPFAFTVVFTLFVIAVVTDERANPVGKPEPPSGPPRPERPSPKRTPPRKIARNRPPAPPKS